MSAAWPDGVGRLVLDEVDSTNDEAVRRLPGLAGPLWILAHRQTAGRGRRGRAWQDPAGNFAATLVMPSADPPGHLALRSFVAALALREALDAVTGAGARLALKWPNDVLLDEGKLAGILLETQAGPPAALAIGFGVNLLSTPPVAAMEAGATPPVSLAAATGLRLAPETLLDALAPAMARREALFRSEGFGPIRAEWLCHAARMGQPLRARMAAEEVTGLFETIDAEGRLVLHTGNARRVIPAAEIHFA